MFSRICPRIEPLIVWAALTSVAWHSVASAEERVSRGLRDVEIKQVQQDSIRKLQPFHVETESIQDRLTRALRRVSWSERPVEPIGCDEMATVVMSQCDCGLCPRADRFQMELEYLYWHMRGAEVPPLVTTSSPGTLRSDAGRLGLANTTILLGDEPIPDDWQSGGRFSFGYVLDDCGHFGLQFMYTTLGDQEDSFGASSDQIAILARPFFNTDALAEDSRILGFPGEVSGQIRVETETEYDVYELLIEQAISLDCDTPTSIVFGYRSAVLDDAIQFASSSTALTGATAGTVVETIERFESRNVFHGFQAGILTSQRISSCWMIDVAGKVAFGETSQTTTIAGESTTTNPPGDVATRSGGLLTQQTNIGTFRSNSHGVLQDLSIRFRRRFTRNIAGTVGYGIHRWVDVVRAGEQIDRSINPTQIPPGVLTGEARPAPLNAKSDFIAQGITFGLNCTW